MKANSTNLARGIVTSLMIVSCNFALAEDAKFPLLPYTAIEQSYAYKYGSSLLGDDWIGTPPGTTGPKKPTGPKGPGPTSPKAIIDFIFERDAGLL